MERFVSMVVFVGDDENEIMATAVRVFSLLDRAFDNLHSIGGGKDHIVLTFESDDPHEKVTSLFRDTIADAPENTASCKWIPPILIFEDVPDHMLNDEGVISDVFHDHIEIVAMASDFWESYDRGEITTPDNGVDDDSDDDGEYGMRIDLS